ncbi:MAG: MFS transporter [Bacteroidales bacterium]|nr:MFS transporter [Bacteroidales bacterium]
MLSNIYKLYIIKTAKWFMLIMPIVVLFYQENGLSMKHVFLLQGIYSVAIVALEIPSGYFADVLGRKKTMVIGSILGFMGFLIYCFSYNFWGFLVAEIILGIGQSFISGSDSALLYDSLKANNRENDYAKYEGLTISIGNFAEAAAGIVGGLLATISLHTPYIAQAAIAFIAIPAAITLTEPYKNAKNRKAGFKDILRIVRYALGDNKTLRWNIIISSIIGSSTLTMAWFVQPYFKAIDLPLTMYGILWTLLNLSVGLTAIKAFKLDQKFGQNRLTTMIIVAIGICFIATGIFQAYWAISILFIFYLVRGIATPVLKDYINRNCESDVRATVLSVRNFVIRIIFSITGPLLGWLTDKYSLGTAIILSGLFTLITGLISLILFIRTVKNQ